MVKEVKLKAAKVPENLITVKGKSIDDLKALSFDLLNMQKEINDTGEKQRKLVTAYQDKLQNELGIADPRNFNFVDIIAHILKRIEDK